MLKNTVQKVVTTISQSRAKAFSLIAGHAFVGLLSAFLSVIVLVAALITSLMSNDYTWFSRSGSLLIAAGVLLGLHNIHHELEQQCREIHHDQSKGGEEDIHQLAINVGRAKHAIETALILIGTLVGGFGDKLLEKFIGSVI